MAAVVAGDGGRGGDGRGSSHGDRPGGEVEEVDDDGDQAATSETAAEERKTARKNYARALRAKSIGKFNTKKRKRFWTEARNKYPSPEPPAKIGPTNDRVLVEKFAAETQSKGGIMLPEKAQGKVLEASVVAVGPGGRGKDGKTIPLCVKAGDKVLLPEYGGSKISISGKVTPPLIELSDSDVDVVDAVPGDDAAQRDFLQEQLVAKRFVVAFRVMGLNISTADAESVILSDARVIHGARPTMFGPSTEGVDEASGCKALSLVAVFDTNADAKALIARFNGPVRRHFWSAESLGP